jgi:hypothetical protein
MTCGQRVSETDFPGKWVSDSGFLAGLLPAVLWMSEATPAYAGRPLTTEDAAIVQGKGCQIESWVDRFEHATKGWFVPSCNFGFNTEWQAGFARTRADGESRFADAYAQAKTKWGAIDRLTLLTEAYGQNSERPFVRVAARWTAIRNTLDVDLSWVSRPGGSNAERLVSFGVTWQLGAFLP